MARKDAVRHRTKVASHTAVPMGTAKWLVWDYPPMIKACLYGRRHVLRMSLTYSKVLCVWVSPSPAISPYITARLYGWLPLSNASGISSVATRHKIKRLRHFHSLRTKTRSAGFPNSTIWNQIFVMHNYKWCLRHFILWIQILLYIIIMGYYLSYY